MRLKNSGLVIEPDRPFLHDRLRRKESADVLTALIKTIDHPFVLAINAGWGHGKTTFIQMWSCTLQNQGFHCLYFNAWQNDFSHDPLVALIGEMESGLKIKTEDKQPSKFAEYWRKTKTLGKDVVKNSLPVATKVMTAGLVDLDAATEGALADIAAKIVEQKIENYESEKHTIENFRSNLEKLVFAITQDTPSKRSIVFFIDELDRCRPTYAIELLERLKHLFNVNGIIFVLAVDMEQLSHSVRSLYGERMNASGYLRRFIDLEYRLPDPDTHAFAEHLLNNYGLDAFFAARTSRFGDEADKLVNTFSELSRIFNLSLRDQEQCFTRISIALRATQPVEPLHPILLAALIVLKYADEPLYRRFVSKETSADDILNCLNKTPSGAQFVNSQYGAFLEALLVASFYNFREEDLLIEKYMRISNDDSSTVDQRQRANRIAEILTHTTRYYDKGIAPFLIKKIEITDQFVTL